MSGVRQEVLNVHLASLISRSGLRAKAEPIKHKRKMPDIVFYHPLFGTLLGEAEVGDVFNDGKAVRKLEEKADERFRDPQFAYIYSAVLVVYPKLLVESISQVNEHRIEHLLSQEQVGIGLASRVFPTGLTAYTSPYQPPKTVWHPSPIYPTQIPSILEDLLRSALGQLVKPENIVEQLINLIEDASKHSANRADENWVAMWESVASQLEIDWNAIRQARDRVYLTAKTYFTLATISLMIYEIARIRFPSKLQALPSPVNFQTIANALEGLGRINYVELVELVLKEVSKVPSEPTLVDIVSQIYKVVSHNINVLMRSGWEVLAAIYQRLLSETYRHAYATFYTKLPAARLLAELSIENVADKVIDPAEGTGSLLISSFYARQWLGLSPENIETLSDRSNGEPLIDLISKHLLENTYGMDALNVAVALSAGNLTIASLAKPHEPLRLYHTPVGIKRSGSLDLLIKTYRDTIMPKEVVEMHNRLSVVIMNPPFTRSDRIPSLIGDEARKELQSSYLTFGGIELRELFVAGLAKPFLALADWLAGDGGRISAVLPNSILSRSAWADVREGISKSCAVKYIVVSWAPGTPNFSSDTDFREILLVLQKGGGDEPMKIINLLKPVDQLDYGDIAVLLRAVSEEEDIALKDNKTIAEITRLPQAMARKYSDNLYRLIAFSESELLKWHVTLVGECGVRLGDLFHIGSEVDHTSGLEVSESAHARGNAYDAIWGSGCEYLRSPTLRNITHRITVRNVRRAKVKFWKTPKAERFYFGSLFLLRRGRLSTQCVLMFRTPRPAVSNVWWPLELKNPNNPITQAYLIFLNSTFGFIHMLGERLETEGVYVEYKKQQLSSMLIPDFTRIPGECYADGIDVLNSSLSRFDRYLCRMSEIEREKGTWENAAVYAANSKEPDLAPRAKLDLTVSKMFEGLSSRLKPPTKLYELAGKEVKVLLSIMEKPKADERGRIKDSGLTRIKREHRTKPLDEWTA